ncbi:MAG TPA: hypothetical protein VNU48_10100, partial [Burkholderiaceae bacterium]|nr:hypothetical protein [Burkholderiaceae bacterium]
AEFDARAGAVEHDEVIARALHLRELQPHARIMASAGGCAAFTSLRDMSLRRNAPCALWAVSTAAPRRAAAS